MAAPSIGGAAVEPASTGPVVTVPAKAVTTAAKAVRTIPAVTLVAPALRSIRAALAALAAAAAAAPEVVVVAGGYSGGNGGTYQYGGTGGSSLDTGTSGFAGSAATENAANQGNGLVTFGAVCYCAGTLIRTTRGDVAVEALKVGDLVITAAGVTRPIKWLGHRTIDCRYHPRPNEVMPVRIAAHAFGPNRPARDLFVSPGHSICVDIVGQVLIPAAALVNGATIRQVEVESITYWHVELDSHDVLLAENLPAESYLDMGNRGFFAEADVVDLAAGPDAVARTTADFCRPFHVEGALVEVVRTRLTARAEQLGWTLDQGSPFADLHLVVDGTRVEPATRRLSARFTVPAGASDVWLVSTTARPCDVGASEDSRALGVWLAGLTIEDGFDARAIALDDPLLGLGLHALEADGRRWTAGRASLPASLWNGCEHSFYLRVDLAGPALARWIAPERSDVVRIRATA